MARPRQRNRSRNTRREDALVHALDDLSDFEQYRAEVLPRLRQMIKQGKSFEEMAKWAEAYLGARAITLALTSENEAVSNSAIKELLDRAKGKATDKREITTRFEKMSDEELEALLKEEEEKSVQ